MGKKIICMAWVLLVAFVGFAEEEEVLQTSKKLPIGADFYLTNNVGAGTAFKAYQQDPYVASTLYLYPYFKTEAFGGEREFQLQAEVSTGLEWVGKDNPINGKFNDKLALGDIKIRAELKKALQASELGFALAPALKLEVPTSKASRDMNRVIGFGGYLSASWSKWGFFVKYKPVGLGYAYSAPFKSGACSEQSLSDDRISDGVCKAAGRQTMFLLKNGLFTGYTGGNHTITAGMRTYHQFLRKAGRGEKPEEKPSSGILESVLGVVEYSYNLTTSLPTTLTLGLSSLQNPYDVREGFRMPFFNFAEANKNQTEAYFAVNVTI